jgi:hypothetical protein
MGKKKSPRLSNSPPSDGEEKQEKVGFLNNLGPEEREKLEERNKKLAEKALIKREDEKAWREWHERKEKVNYIKERISSARDRKIMQEHSIEEDSEGWLICTICNKKLSSLEDLHLTSEKHIKNLAWHKGKLVPKTAATETPSSSSLPVYVHVDEEGCLVCKFCQKKAWDEGMMETHLQGKEHAKKCSSRGLPLYGEPRHVDEAKAYIYEYGYDEYARLSHWPECILDGGMTWNCTQCNKKFPTQAGVNEHLKEPNHTGRSTGPPPPARPAVRVPSRSAPRLVPPSDAPVLVPPPPPGVPSIPLSCQICLVDFNDPDTYDRHVKTLAHINLARWRSLDV